MLVDRQTKGRYAHHNIPLYYQIKVINNTETGTKGSIKNWKQSTHYRAVEFCKRVEHVEAMHIYNSSIYTQLSSV